MSTAKLKKVEDAFSERLKMLRLERGWSQEDLAARLEVSPGSVGNWEMGPHVPHPKTLRKMAALFDVEVFFLLHGDREEAPAAIREKLPEYKAVDLAGLLREVEGARDKLDQIAQQLRKANIQPGAATLAEVASASYDQKRGSGKSRVKEAGDTDAQRLVAKTESK
jgi:transcriptional regulator with XRE-family HTH domain